jgi:hypothetical protein
MILRDVGNSLRETGAYRLLNIEDMGLKRVQSNSEQVSAYLCVTMIHAHQVRPGPSVPDRPCGAGRP